MVISGFLNEFLLNSLDMAVTKDFELSQLNEEFKEVHEFYPNILFDNSLDILFASYIPNRSLKEVQNQIHNLYKLTESYFEERNEYKYRFEELQKILINSNKENRKYEVCQNDEDSEEETGCRLYNINVMRNSHYVSLKYKIDELLGIPKSVSKLLDQELKLSIFYDKIKHSELIDLLKNTIENLNKSPSQEGDVIKEIIVDFLYKFKDKHPFSNPFREGPMDVFDDIMEFLNDNELEPSKKLQYHYCGSELYRILNKFPSLEQLEHEFNSEYDKEVYKELEKLFYSKPAFKFYFDPDIEITTKVDDEEGRRFKTGFFTKGESTSIGAGMFVSKDGEIYQGYFKADKKHIYGRAFSWVGVCYTGCYKQDHGMHGKGEVEDGDGTKEKGYFDNCWRQGIFECWDQDGRKSTKIYKNSKKVEKPWWSFFSD